MIILKPCIFILVFSTFVVSSFAQSDTVAISRIHNKFNLFDKRKNMIQLGGSVGLSSNAESNISIDSRFGRFLFKKFVAGIQVYNLFTNTLIHYGYGVGPFLKYYILNKHFSPFVESNYYYNHFRNTDVGSPFNLIENKHMIWIGAGIAYTGIFKRIGIESKIGYLETISYLSGSINSNQKNPTVSNKLDIQILNIIYYF